MRLVMRGSFRKARGGAVYIEFAMSALILMLLAIGVVNIGAKEIDVNRDNRVVWTALELASQLDEEISFASPQDMEAFGRSIATTSSFTTSEQYQIIVTAYEFDSTQQPSVRWQGTYGRTSSNLTRLSSDLNGVYLDNQSYIGRSNERLIFVELFRERRGLGLNASSDGEFYSSGVMAKEAP